MPALSHFGKTVYLASDHAGFEYKNTVYNWLLSEGWKAVDCGPAEYQAEDDFPALIAPAARLVAQAPAESCALIFGGSGQGEAMTANRHVGVRAAVYYGGNDAIVTLSREHNDANVLSIGARFVAIDEVKRVVWLWLHTTSNYEEKYQRRNSLLDSVIT